MSLHVLKNKKVSALRWYIFRNPMADQQVGDAFSLASLVHPLAGSQASAVFEVLANVPQELAAPILQATSAAKLGTALSEQAAKNIIWKVAHYLPSLIRSKTTPEGLSDKLKAFQQLSPDTPLAHVPNQRSTCAFCQGEKPLKARATVDKATIPNNLPGMSVQEHRFRVYSHAAGLQFARFGEMQCPECKLFFLGCWAFKKEQGLYGHISDIVFAGPDSTETGFVCIPKYRSYYAVEVQLLQQLGDTLDFCSGSMQSAVTVWARQHKEPLQQKLLFGEDRTMLGHIREDLAMAWYAWSTAKLTGNKLTNVKWNFSNHFDDSLLEHGVHIRTEQLQKVAAHMKSCPRCLPHPFAVGDGKHGARRMICAGLDGKQSFPDLGVQFDTGCIRLAHAKHMHCSVCRKETDAVALIAGQQKVTGTETMESEDGTTAETKYFVEATDPTDSDKTVEFLLPRSEVQRSLLHEFERKLLPRKKDHGNLKQRPQKIKGPRQRAWWGKRQKQGCSAGSRQDRDSKNAKCYAQKRPKAAGKAATKAASKGKAKPKSRAKAQKARTTVMRPADEDEAAGGCPVNKEWDQRKRRRVTGGIFTCVLSCGYLADWVELWRGEQLELVYAFLLRFYKDMRIRGVTLECIGYDNACKLLAMARTKRDTIPPWTADFVDKLAIVLDNFHRDNHTWCLVHMKEVDPQNKTNVPLLADKNTEACEQLNSWITLRTRASFELPPGRFLIYWWMLLSAHNEWLEEEAACKRRRYSRGGMKHDPDRPKPKSTGQ
jgi:hypothetical protein